MAVYFIGCLHLGHVNMATYRGFQDVASHDSRVIDGILGVVNKSDKLFILGDITMENSKYYHLLSKIHAYKHVVLGNHDMSKHVGELSNYVDAISGCVKYKHAILSHIPVHPRELQRFGINVHAHIHHKTPLEEPGYVNVDAHVLNYTPISWEAIMSIRLNDINPMRKEIERG